MRETLGDLVVLNIVDGEIAVPRVHKNRVKALLVVAIRPGEQFRVSKDLIELTPEQQERFKAQAEEHDPGLTKAYQSIIDTSESAVLTPAISGWQAMVFGLSTLIDGSLVGPSVPPRSIVRVRHRPVLALLMEEDADDDIISPGVMAHETTHVRQKNQTPVEVFISQEESDMSAFEDELEAYHIGAGFSLALQEIDGTDPTDLSDIQIAVEAIRRTHGGSGATPELLRKYGEYGMRHMLHARFDFNAAREQFDKITQQAAGAS